MTTYEMTFLLNEEAELKNLKKLITDSDGRVVNEEPWGKKDLAYPIKKQSSALFYSFMIEIAENKVIDLRKKLNFNEKLLRYLLLKTD